MEEREQPTFLIPANSKKSALIAGMFKPFDLGLFITGVIITFLLLFAIPGTTLGVVIIKLAPALLCTFLTLPIPNYHNTRVLIREVVTFFTDRKIYYWKGWCIYDETESKK